MTDSAELQRRTKQFGLRVIRLTQSLPETREARVIANQILRSATSVGANYRATLRSRSDAEFAARMAVVVEEADETGYWLEMLADSEIVKPALLTPLMRESDELVRIFSAARKTTQAHINRKSKIENREFKEDET